MTFRVLLHHLQRQQYLPGKKRALAFLFFPQPLWLKIPKKFSLLSLRAAALLWKPLVIRFCPLKFFSDYFRIFYTVNIPNLKKSEKNFKGQKRFTKGFLKLTLLASLAHCDLA